MLLWVSVVIESMKPSCSSLLLMLFLVHQSTKSLAKAHSSLLSGAVLKDSGVSGVRTDPKWTAGRKQSGCDWILANMTAMVSSTFSIPTLEEFGQL